MLIAIAVSLFCCFYPYRRKAKIRLKHDDISIQIFFTNASFIQIKADYFYITHLFEKTQIEHRKPINCDSDTHSNKEERSSYNNQQEKGSIIPSGETKMILTCLFASHFGKCDKKRRRIVIEDSTGKKYSKIIGGRSYKMWKQFCEK